MLARLGIEFLILLAGLVGCLLLYRKLAKSKRFGRAVNDLAPLSDEEDAVRIVDEALEMAEEVADDLEEAQARKDALLKELRRKTRL